MKSNKLLTKADAIIMAVITVIFAFIDFMGIGSIISPETFADFSADVALVEFEHSVQLDHIMMFTGVRTGTYKIEYSDNGINYDFYTEFEQSYGEVLRWENISTVAASNNTKYVRISATDNPFLGEVVFYDVEGNRLNYTCNISEICDEQDTVVGTYSYKNSTYFDEIYHARTAWEHLNGIWPYEISHPPLGKIIISLGILIFGMSPFGWRFSGVFVGVLMLPVLYVFVKRMFGNRRIAILTTIIFGTDFMHFVQTRIATIDTYSVFFILLMYLFMYMFITEDDRRYLALSGIAFGLGAASKWTCLYAGAGLAVIWLIYHIIHRENLLKNIGFSFIFFVIVPGIIYYLSYIPYGIAQGCTPVFSGDYFRIVTENQSFMFSYHSNLVAEHPYSSKWYQWIFNIRPILYYLEYFDNGTRSSFGCFMNPALCIGGLASLILVIFDAVKTRSKESLFIVIGYLAQLIPWIFVTRLTFEYHYFPSTVFLALSVAYVFNKLQDDQMFSYMFTSVSIALFIYFYPVLSGLPVNANTTMYKWLQTWPF